MKNICEQAALYFYGEMDAQQAAQFKQHLANCEACRREIAFLQATQEALFPPAAPQAIVERVLQGKKIPFWKRVYKLALGGALVLILGVYGFFHLPLNQTEQNNTDWIAYVSVEADTQYQSFVTDFEAFENDF
ncbi:MAG: zf-HC2 domain-containing protein [Elusimicrobiaceae bacterium]|nr:zf-HC2 domain-containing protein [Elusimicrobiaceae bacterium]